MGQGLSLRPKFINLEGRKINMLKGTSPNGRVKNEIEKVRTSILVMLKVF
jgi:hypothetical protein